MSRNAERRLGFVISMNRFAKLQRLADKQEKTLTQIFCDWIDNIKETPENE